MEKMQALEEAILLLDGKCMELAKGSTPVYAIVHHAKRHLERQLDALLRGA